jgi:hypothetical protein
MFLLRLSGQSFRFQALAIVLMGLLRLRIVGHRLLGLDRLECLVGFPQSPGRGMISRHVDLNVGKTGAMWKRA